MLQFQYDSSEIIPKGDARLLASFYKGVIDGRVYSSLRTAIE
jgi:hypothetical protein